MDSSDTEQLQVLTQRVLDLAKTVVTIRAELDAMRLLCTGYFAVAASDPAFSARLAVTLQAVFDADAALALNSEVPDDMLQARSDWLKHLTPPHLRTGLRFP
ncbi:hypothetical protein [Pelomonas sp. KK5]|uniref:hypothetical protein n=1 Tax=Pelomonas sp. KK5 TaxID=1855730 RepID=UPI00097C2037|nr:hypothetical protein [Pelomonas sp. KK5]